MFLSATAGCPADCSFRLLTAPLLSETMGVAIIHGFMKRIHSRLGSFVLLALLLTAIPAASATILTSSVEQVPVSAHASDDSLRLHQLTASAGQRTSRTITREGKFKYPGTQLAPAASQFGLLEVQNRYSATSVALRGSYDSPQASHSPGRAPPSHQ